MWRHSRTVAMRSINESIEMKLGMTRWRKGCLIGHELHWRNTLSFQAPHIVLLTDVLHTPSMSRIVFHHLNSLLFKTSNYCTTFRQDGNDNISHFARYRSSREVYKRKKREKKIYPDWCFENKLWLVILVFRPTKRIKCICSCRVWTLKVHLIHSIWKNSEIFSNQTGRQSVCFQPQECNVLVGCR